MSEKLYAEEKLGGRRDSRGNRLETLKTRIKELQEKLDKTDDEKRLLDQLLLQESKGS